MPRRSRSEPLAAASPDDARERILAAAQRCIDRHGIRKTTMDDIASEVGQSRPNVYRYFADRDDLLIELITRHVLLNRAHKSISRQNSLTAPQVKPRVESLPYEYCGRLLSRLPAEMRPSDAIPEGWCTGMWYWRGRGPSGRQRRWSQLVDAASPSGDHM
jgi:AcrR family transcriptional regulator